MNNTMVMNTSTFNMPARTRGVSLIELMISLVIGLIIILAVGQVYVGSRTTYRTQDALSRLQENARYAMDTISYDLRMSGQLGCSVDKSKSANVLTDPSSGDLLGTPIKGVDKGGAAVAPFTATTANGDVIRIFRADETTEALISSSNAAANILTISAWPDPGKPFVNGDVLVATDCSTAAVFQATTVAGTTVTHTGGNCTTNIGPVTVAGGGCPVTSADTFAAGTKVSRVIGNLYYVADSAGQSSLFRQQLKAGATTSEALVEGVKDMEITYGLDTNGDGSIDSVDQTAAVAAANWSQVLSVKISLLMQTAETNVAPVKQQYTWRGVTGDAADNRLYRVFSTTIALRGRT